MTTAARITCRRCAGTGLVNCVNEHGRCFGCGGRGWNHADPFVNHFGAAPGLFYGLSYPSGPFVRKELVKDARPLDRFIKTVDTGLVTVTPLTEDQARRFFARYGDNTAIKP